MRTPILLTLVLLAGAARADPGGVALVEDEEGDVVTAPVEVRGTRAGGDAQAEGAARALEEPAFVTVVEVDRLRAETISAAEALAETVGVSVRSLGGLGAFASISMRGAPSGQTEVLVDGVPLSRVAFSSVDLGTLDLATFERVEVIRGGVPAELGGAVLGGAVNFVSAIGPSASGARTGLTLGGGSFGARRARVARGDAFGRLETSLAAGYAGATGDFDYFDDNGTPLNPSDDATRVRENNGFDALDLAARAALAGATRVSGGARYSHKDQGVSGPTGTRARHARLATHRGLVDVEGRRVGLGGAPVAVGVRAFGLVETQRWRDLEAEVGLAAADSTFTTGAAGLVVAGDFAPTERHRISAALEGRAELLDMADHLSAERSATGRRLGGSLALADEIALLSERLVLVPGVRLDVFTTRGEGTENPVIGDMVPDARDDTFVSPRVSARWRAAPAVTLKANAGRYFRPPTVIELFGDRGVITGNGSLRPETGYAADAGIVLAPARAHGPVDRIYLEAALFASRVSDLITFLPTSGRRSRAANLSGADILGLELALATRLARTLTLTGNYTLLESAQRSSQVSADGRRLPGRPRHELYLRADVARRVGASRFVLGGFADATLVSGNFLDAGNLNEVPPRRLFGVGLRASLLPGLALVVQVKNLFDVRVEDVGSAVGPIPRAVADVLDYPLPGRAFHATLDWSF